MGDETEMIDEMEGNADEVNADLANPDEDNADECNAGFGNVKESITDMVVESISDESEVINDKSENGLDIDENTERNQVTGQGPSGGLVTEGYAQKVNIDSDEENIEEAIDVVNT